MSDADKKQFFRIIIKSNKIYSDVKSKDRALKHIDFRSPVRYDSEDGLILLRMGNDVETVCLLTHK